MSQPQYSERTIRFLILLIFLAAAMETDIYLPAFPDMMHAYATNELMIQRVLSFNFLGVCLASLIYGPASDSFGRKKVLNIGYFLFVVASFGCVFANTIETLIFWRFIQGFGSAACMIIGAAVVFDMYKAEKAAKLVGDLNSLVVSIIAFAPMIGGWINYQLGYHYNFLFIAALSLVTGAICFSKLPESLAMEKRKPFRVKAIGGNYLTVLKSSEFWANTIVTTMIFAGYMVFVSNMSLIFVDKLGVHKAHFPFYQFSLLIAFVIASVNSGRLIDWFGLNKMRNLGYIVLIASALFMWAMPVSWQQDPLIVTAVMVVYSFGAGICIGIFFTRSMEAVPNQTGVSASLVTSIRLALVAIIIDISSDMYDGTMTTVVQIVAYCTIASIIAYGANELIQAKKHSEVLN
ncbi:multidrug effflux MFS transporter [Vibrio marisflavi]|uniref:Bcr/CflA family efflux transporter n=1 Tax=Vibrio marisflavi CECT 7928 TaxID=634439 RepID=A0ABN8EA43_9VIBR|nr:multidrug effflux MFS transporter [Vibrio marisflavi]CAH0540341.1 Bicyclomycin resistance protein [Vibrio marisflavi CECT 7928]